MQCNAEDTQLTRQYVLYGEVASPAQRRNAPKEWIFNGFDDH